MPIPNDRKVDHLLLLVGGNPLPNAIAGRLLVRDGGTITLVHSAAQPSLGVVGTHDVARRLKKWLRKSVTGIRVDMVEVDESDGAQIRHVVREVVNGIAGGTVGLNYTGGTKAMAVHAYRAVDEWQRDRFDREPLFSYLDARELAIRFDEGKGVYPVGLDVKLHLDELMTLHGRLERNHHSTPRTQPVLPQSARGLAIGLQDTNSRTGWYDWIKSCIRPLNHPKPGWDKRQKRFVNWKTEAYLATVTIPWPPVIADILRQELEALGYPPDIPHIDFGELIKLSGQSWQRVDDFLDWIDGAWLESYALGALQGAAPAWHFHEMVAGIETWPVRFEVDVIGIRGYQLFAFSCGTEASVHKLKLKLFEAAQRAQQLGGEEARVCLICMHAKPDLVAQQIRQTITERVEVFGRSDLPDLSAKLSDWISTQVGGS